MAQELPHWLNAPALRPCILAVAHPHAANTGVRAPAAAPGAGVTPFRRKAPRSLRLARDIRQREMARALEISPAYLSALEHGRRGAPSAGLIHQICQFFGLIWDDADELAALARVSRPRLKLNAAGMTPAQTALANRLARELRQLDAETVAAMQRAARRGPAGYAASTPAPRKKPSKGSRLSPRMVK